MKFSFQKYKPTISYSPFNLFCLFLTFINISAQNNSSNSTTNTTIPSWLNNTQTELDRFYKDSYNYYVTTSGNKVWSAAMNLAWNEAKQNIAQQQNLTFYNTNQLQDKLIQNLNSDIFTKNQLSPSAYYIKSGYGPETIDIINLEGKQKFPQLSFKQLAFNLSEKDFISYAYFFKKILYPSAFADLTGFKFKNVTVEAFFANTSKQKSQIYYKYYQDQNNFLMGINAQNQNDQILLLKSSSVDVANYTFSKIVTIVDGVSQMANRRIATTDKFQMPVIDFDFKRNYQQLVNLNFSNYVLLQYKISQMYEALKVKVTKEGVKAQNQAVIVGVRSSFALNPKYFILDNTFWLILKQKNKKPYLIIQVNNPKQTWLY